MPITVLKLRFLLRALTTLLLAAQIAGAQEYTRRLRSPATARGLVGAESHDSYVIRARKDQRMTVEISWRHEHDPDTEDNHAEFFVGELPNFNGDGEVKFGRASDSGRRWSGKIPRTGDYYIYVMAYPTAHYRLRVRVE